MKVFDVFRIGDKLSVTLEGKCEEIHNGSRLINNSNREYKVISVAMVNNPSDFARTTTVLLPLCDIHKGEELYVA